MKLLLTAFLASVLVAGGVRLAAVPPSLPTPPSLKPEPPPPPPVPPPANPVPPPAPGPPGPAVPIKPSEKRCPLDKPHRAHNWMDKTGQIFHCDGGVLQPPR